MTEHLGFGSVDPLWVWIAVAATAVLLAQAALAKLADRALFEQHLAAYGLPHALGPAPLAFDPDHARRVADLQLYVRQHHAERDEAALGAQVRDLSTWF